MKQHATQRLAAVLLALMLAGQSGVVHLFHSSDCQHVETTACATECDAHQHDEPLGEGFQTAVLPGHQHACLACQFVAGQASFDRHEVRCLTSGELETQLAGEQAGRATSLAFSTWARGPPATTLFLG